MIRNLRSRLNKKGISLQAATYFYGRTPTTEVANESDPQRSLQDVFIGSGIG